jgi:hypothetical protein
VVQKKDIPPPFSPLPGFSLSAKATIFAMIDFEIPSLFNAMFTLMAAEQ